MLLSFMYILDLKAPSSRTVLRYTLSPQWLLFYWSDDFNFAISGFLAILLKCAFHYDTFLFQTTQVSLQSLQDKTQSPWCLKGLCSDSCWTFQSFVCRDPDIPELWRPPSYACDLCICDSQYLFTFFPAPDAVQCQLWEGASKHFIFIISFCPHHCWMASLLL